MPYITRQNDISELPLSVRSLNCLRRADIHTIGAMMDYPSDELINIRNMGKKSVKEIQRFVQDLKNGTGEYVLAEYNEITSDESATRQAENVSGCVTVFFDEAGAVVQDISIKDLQLSVRAKNSLIRSGYSMASQLVGVSYKELMNTQNIGSKTAEEILAYLKKILVSYVACAETSGINDLDYNTVTEMCSAYGKSVSVWSREVSTI